MTKATEIRKNMFGFRVPEQQEPIMWGEGWQQAADIAIGAGNCELTSFSKPEVYEALFFLSLSPVT